MPKVLLEPITAVVLSRANKRGAQTRRRLDAIVQADVEKVEGILHLRMTFRDGSRLSVPASRIEEISHAKAGQLKLLEISPAGDSISFPDIDADMYIPGLLSDLYGSSVRAVQGRNGGKRSTPQKTVAVRANGRKGGRPKKKTKVT